MEKNTNNKSFYKNIFGKKNNVPQNQSTNRTTNVTTNTTVKSLLPDFKNINIKIILISFGIILLLCLIIYIVICAVHYSKITCYEKKTFFNYLFDFSNNEVCILENKPIPVTPKELPPEHKKMSLLPPLEKKKEVFHIANQDYTYDQSKCKCESYGARLATKSELIDAYNKGANWCTYGWTEKQTAYYPVQQCDWDKINEQNERLPDNAKKYCGLPGLNGGYFANPNLKFGVNCYGQKPQGELNKQKEPYCPPMNFCKLESNFEAAHKLDTDEIVGFSDDKWSMNI
jgi:hypothetical protein